MYFVIIIQMFENVYDELYEYAAFTRYPITSSKNEPRIIRRKCFEHYYAADGLLYYSSVGTNKALKLSSLLDRKWRVVVRTLEEGKRIIDSSHSSPFGRYIDYDMIIVIIIDNYTV